MRYVMKKKCYFYNLTTWVGTPSIHNFQVGTIYYIGDINKAMRIHTIELKRRPKG